MFDSVSSTTAKTIDSRHLEFVQRHRVARLATADASGTPSVIPICFAVINDANGPWIAIAVDEKPKGDPWRLKRVRNILERPEVSIVVDDYSDEWDRLAWVLLRGSAAVLSPVEPDHEEAVRALRSKYPQYASMKLDALPVISVRELSSSAWGSAAAERAQTAPRVPGDELGWVVRNRRSVRAFSSQPIDRRIVLKAIEAAGWAPNPHGRQPWRFAVVEDESRRIALADAMADTWRAQLELDQQEPAVVEVRLEKSRERLCTAPVLIVPCLYLEDLDDYPDPQRQEAERTMAVQSIGSAIQNLLLTLYADGVDGGWMCAPLFCPDVVRESLGLAATLHPQALIPVGYAAREPVRRPRMPVEELIVDWR
jgi:PPOX class probable F420-dependent enzyme